MLNVAPFCVQRPVFIRNAVAFTRHMFSVLAQMCTVDGYCPLGYDGLLITKADCLKHCNNVLITKL